MDKIMDIISICLLWHKNYILLLVDDARAQARCEFGILKSNYLVACDAL